MSALLKTYPVPLTGTAIGNTELEAVSALTAVRPIEATIETAGREAHPVPAPLLAEVIAPAASDLPELSSASQLIAHALDPTSEPHSSARSPLDAAPLPKALNAEPLSTTPNDASALAERLSRSIASSGLFYESHLAQWVSGERTLESVKSELRSNPSPDPAHSGHVVCDQLQALSAQAIAWTGEPWPAQSAQILIGEETAPDNHPSPSTWHAQIAIDTPGLGRMEVGLQFDTHRLQLAVIADSAEHCQQLTVARDVLLSALQARGMNASAQFSVAPATQPSATTGATAAVAPAASSYARSRTTTAIGQTQ